MFIAITSDKGNVFQHFGKAVEFTYIETEDERIISRKIITKESHNKNQAEFLKELKTDLVICGGIGSGAKAALKEKKIEFVCGVEGDVMQAVVDYLSGLRIGNEDFICTKYSYIDSRGCDCGCPRKIERL